VRRRIAEVGRTSSGSEKRAIGIGRVESPLGNTRRVNGSLTTGGAQARKRRGPPVAKGGRFIEARRSSSRERRAIDERDAVSFVLRRGRDVRSDCRWKTPRIGNAHAFHEAPAEPVLATFEPQFGLPEKRPTPTSSEEATGESEASGIQRTRRKKTPPRDRWSGRRSEDRAVKRGSPQSRLHRAAPSLPVPGSRVFGRARRYAKKTFA